VDTTESHINATKNEDQSPTFLIITTSNYPQFLAGEPGGKLPILTLGIFESTTRHPRKSTPPKVSMTARICSGPSQQHFYKQENKVCFKRNGKVPAQI
jgi:hypothetical protein